MSAIASKLRQALPREQCKRLLVSIENKLTGRSDCELLDAAQTFARADLACWPRVPGSSSVSLRWHLS
jgi:hypothetical protein